MPATEAPRWSAVRVVLLNRGDVDSAQQCIFSRHCWPSQCILCNFKRALGQLVTQMFDEAIGCSSSLFYLFFYFHFLFYRVRAFWIFIRTNIVYFSSILCSCRMDVNICCFFFVVLCKSRLIGLRYFFRRVSRICVTAKEKKEAQEANRCGRLKYSILHVLVTDRVTRMIN